MTRWGHHGCPDRFTALPRESDALHAISHNKTGPRRPKARAIFLCDLSMVRRDKVPVSLDGASPRYTQRLYGASIRCSAGRRQSHSPEGVMARSRAWPPAQGASPAIAPIR